MAKAYQGDYKHDYKMRPYNLDYRPGETDLQYYKRLAKVADQRLLRLERLSEVAGYEKVTNYAYDRAMRDLEIYGGGKRFNTKPPVNADGTIDNRLLSEKLADMRTFLSSVTSTKAGIEQVYSKRAQTFNEKFGTDYTWQDLADLYQSGDADRLLKRYKDSDIVQRAIGVIQQAEGKLKEEMKKNKKVTIDKKKDRLVFEKALDILGTTDLNLSILKGKTAAQKARMEEIIKEMQKEERQK
ncbi:MAG: hypothetical protein J6R32_02450 [Bacteroidales bacterium]|nr:hypothetical protein [Bacteroidales bacterium]